MIQSVVRQGQVDEAVAGYGHVIVDECHHLGAFTFERVLSEVKAKFVVGLTATPYRRDGHQAIIHMQVGPVRFAADWRKSGSDPPLNHRLIVRETGFLLPGTNRNVGIQEIYAALTADDRRNELVVGDVKRALDEGRSPIVLTARRDHLELLADQLRDFVEHIVVLRGGMGSKKRREEFGRLASIPDEESGFFWRPGGTLERGLTTLASTPSFSCCRFPGRGRSCSAPAGLVVRTSARAKFEFTTTSTPMFQLSCGCSRGGFGATWRSGTARRRARPRALRRERRRRGRPFEVLWIPLRYAGEIALLLRNIAQGKIA